GGGAIGGTIRYISTKPQTDATHVQLGSTLSSTDHGGNNYDVRGMLNLPLIQDKVALRANLGYFDNQGYVDNVRTGRDGINFDRTLSGRLALLARPTDLLSVELTHYYQRGDYGAGPGRYEQFGGFEVDNFAPGAQAQRKAELTNLSLTYDFARSQLV